jgi:hypothetical protein
MLFDADVAGQGTGGNGLTAAVLLHEARITKAHPMALAVILALSAVLFRARVRCASLARAIVAVKTRLAEALSDPAGPMPSAVPMLTAGNLGLDGAAGKREQP